MNGVELIAAERKRQIEQEGFSAEKDDRYTKKQLQSAAICYLVPVLKELVWPQDWSLLWWKPTPNDRIRELIKAGALIAAEIDRLQRAAKPVDNPSTGKK